MNSPTVATVPSKKIIEGTDENKGALFLEGIKYVQITESKRIYLPTDELDKFVRKDLADYVIFNKEGKMTKLPKPKAENENKKPISTPARRPDLVNPTQITKPTVSLEVPPE